MPGAQFPFRFATDFIGAKLAREADSSVCLTQRMLSFVRMRPRPSRAPTGLCAARYRFCPQGVGALLAGDGPRSGPRVCLIQRSCKFYCRFPADRWQAKLLRPSARIKSVSRRRTVPLLPAGRRSLACRRWVAKRPQGLSDPTQLQVLLPVPGRSLASQAPTASGQNQKRLAALHGTASARRA